MGRPSDTMSIGRMTTSGGRTRNVINVAAPGHTGSAAYTFTSTTNSPTSATDGYRNWNSQRYLHVHVSGNVASGEGAQINLWGYNAFAGRWGVLQRVDPTDSSKYTNVQLTSSTSEPRRYYIVDVNGAERIAAECTDHGGGEIYLYLGVNSF